MPEKQLSKVMKLKMMQYIARRTAMVAALSAAMAACSEPLTEADPDSPTPVSEVIIAVPELSAPQLSTRVALVDDPDSPVAGQSVAMAWSDGDTFALWATGDAAADECKNMKFEYLGTERYPAGDAVLFRSLQVPLMSEGEYTYRAFYPYTDDVDKAGNRINYEIPTVQNGAFNGGTGIMVAEAVRSEALVRDRYNQGLDLAFRHETHALKITVPESSNLFGHEITRIRIEFPQPVAGRLSFDTATGEALTEGITENTVDILFDEPLVSGEPFWVFIAPTELSGEVKFSAYGGEEETYMCDPSIAPAGAFGNLAKGHITPVKLGIKESYSVTWFNYEILDCSRLGEEVESLNLTLPAELRIANRSDVDGVAKIYRDGQGLYRASFRTAELTAYLEDNDLDLQAKYESEHALLSPYATDIDKFVITRDNCTPDGTHTYTIDYAPYIFEEDFSGVSSFSNDGDNPTGSFSSTTEAKSLAEVNLPGWSAARSGGEAGKAVRICGRTEDGFFAVARYHGRLDSPALSNIKEGVTAKVSVSFNYSMGRNNSTNHTPCFAYGVHTTQGNVNAASGNNSNLSNPVASGVEAPLEGTYDNIGEFIEYTTSCTSEHRLAWEVYTSGRQTGNSNSWLYIDNVKVSIAGE